MGKGTHGVGNGRFLLPRLPDALTVQRCLWGATIRRALFYGKIGKKEYVTGSEKNTKS